MGTAAVVIVLALSLLAAPAAVAKAPVFLPHGCPHSAAKASAPAPIRARCEALSRQAAPGADRATAGSAGWVDAGIVAALVLAIAGITLVATRRQSAEEPQPAAFA
jgi:hypothetical protein